MITCGDSCWPLCDFCSHYSFNGDDKGRYTGDGYCNKLNKPSEPQHGGECADFHCYTVKDNAPA